MLLHSHPFITTVGPWGLPPFKWLNEKPKDRAHVILDITGDANQLTQIVKRNVARSPWTAPKQQSAQLLNLAAWSVDGSHFINKCCAIIKNNAIATQMVCFVAIQASSLLSFNERTVMVSWQDGSWNGTSLCALPRVYEGWARNRCITSTSPSAQSVTKSHTTWSGWVFPGVLIPCRLIFLHPPCILFVFFWDCLRSRRDSSIGCVSTRCAKRELHGI